MKQLLFVFLVLTGCNVKQVIIKPGELGVTEAGDIVTPGTHTLNSSNVFVYNTREFPIDISLDVLSKDESVFSGAVSLRVYPDKQNIDRLHNTFGPDYKELVVIPEARSSVRTVLSRIHSDSLTVIDRHGIELDIAQDLKKNLAAKHIILSYFAIKNLIPPSELEDGAD